MHSNNHRNHKSSTLNASASEFSLSPCREITHDEERLPSIKEGVEPPTECIEDESITGITEEEGFSYPRAVYWEQQQPLPPPDDIVKSRNLIWISQEITAQTIENEKTNEYFATAGCLAYYLRLQCRKQVVDGDYKIFRSRLNGQELVIFNAELSKAHTDYVLYIIAYPNYYKGKSKIKWAMDRFMTAPEIYKRFRINCGDLPAGSRWKLIQKAGHMMADVMNDLYQFKNRLYSYSMLDNLMNLDQITSKKKTSHPWCFSVYQMAEYIEYAIERKMLIPVLWFHKRKPQYHIQMLLPIEVAYGQWIGITFDYKDSCELRMDKFCVDDVDIRRKCALFKPSKNNNAYMFFSNDIKEIHIRY